MERRMREPLTDLMHEVLERTKVGTMTWEAPDDDTCRVQIGPGHFRLRRSFSAAEGGEGRFPEVAYTLDITDAQGRVLIDVRLTTELSYYGYLEELFERARKSATSSDLFIREMLAALRSNA
jgi:hypothetical protein